MDRQAIRGEGFPLLLDGCWDPRGGTVAARMALKGARAGSRSSLPWPLLLLRRPREEKEGLWQCEGE